MDRRAAVGSGTPRAMDPGSVSHTTMMEKIRLPRGRVVWAVGAEELTHAAIKR